MFDHTPSASPAVEAADAAVAVVASEKGAEKCTTATLAEKVELIKRELGLDPSLSLVQAVRAAHATLGTEPEGPFASMLYKQVRPSSWRHSLRDEPLAGSESQLSALLFNLSLISTLSEAASAP